MSTALLARSAAPDRAFERLYRRHVHEVYRYVLAVLRNQADAEDATQATFLSAYRAFARGEEPRKPRNWLLKIAHNECRQRFRAASRRPREVEWDERTPAPALDETVPTVDEIRTALGHLSFNQRSALVMRELEGRSYAEIAKVLDLSVSAVETLLFRARRALREQLEGGLTCGEAEATLSRRLDVRITLSEQRALRAHLRACRECSVLERKQRARRAAVKRLGAVQLPPSLAGFLGGTSSVTGGAVASSGIVAKTAAVVAAGVVAGGVGHEAVRAVAADKPARPPLSELRHVNRQVEIVRAGAVSRARTARKPVSAAGSRVSSRPIRVRGGVRPALGSTPPAAADEPASSPAIETPSQSQPVTLPSAQPAAALKPVRGTVESVTNTASRVRTPSLPQPPPVTPPSLPVQLPVQVPIPPLPPPPLP